MSDSTFRSLPTEAAQPLPVPEPDGKTSFTSDPETLRPIEKGDGSVLELLGVRDDLNVLPEQDKANYNELEQYLLDSLSSRGVSPTVSNAKETFEDLKLEMGLDKNAEPSIILDRMGGILRAWKSLSFINDSHDKKRIFMRLANAKSSKDMNKIVFDEMTERRVWS